MTSKPIALIEKVENMSILIGTNARDGKLAAKIYNMALARCSFGTDADNVSYQAFDSLCVEEINKAFEPYNKKHTENGFGPIDRSLV